MKKVSKIYLIGILCFFAAGLTSGYLWSHQGIDMVMDKMKSQFQNRRAPQLDRKKITAASSKYLDSNGNVEDYGKYIQAKREEWASMTPLELRKEYTTLSDSEQEKEFLHDLFREWAKSQPYDALNFALELREKKERNSKIAEITSFVADNNPELVLNFVMANKESCYDFEILKDAFNKLAQKDDDLAWKKLRSMSLLEQDTLLPSFIEGVHRKNPDKLSQYLSNIDLRAAEGRLSNTIMEKLDQSIALSELGLDELELSEDRKSKIEQLRLKRLALDDFTDFEKKFSKLPQKDKENFLNYDDGQYNFHDNTFSILNNIAPDKLLAFIERETQSGADMSKAVQHLFQQWPAWDREGMLRTMENLPEGKNKQMAKVAYASTCPYLDHRKNMELIESLQLTDNQLKQRLLFNAYLKWHAESPRDAETSMNQSVLSERERNSIKHYNSHY